MFITFEGTEGCGKSTLIRLLSKKLEKEKIVHLVTREPGGSSVAEAIRNLILHQEMDPLTELFLYEAARAEHYKKAIAPALKAKILVLCDRFTDSTVAYQGYARGLELKIIHPLNRIATTGRAPDLTFFLDLPVKEGLLRASDPNKFEREGLSFQNKVRKGFLASIKKEPRRWKVIHVSGKTPEEVCEEAYALITRSLAKKGGRKG